MKEVSTADAAHGMPSPEHERLGHLLDGTPDIAVLWELCAHFEWADRKTTVDGIMAWLGPPDGLRILDCACGTGFPAIDLALRGYDVTCSDGSPVMLEHFRRNARRQGADLRAERVLWEDLTARYDESFDVVMCRGGGSYLYAGTWDQDLPPDRDALVTALRQFVACARPGGRLYVDIMRAEDLADLKPQRTVRPAFTVGAHTVELQEEVTNHPERGLRVWRSRVSIDGTAYEFERRSHHLRQDELLALLGDAGLMDIHREVVPGEHYDVFSGTKPMK